MRLLMILIFTALQAGLVYNPLLAQKKGAKALAPWQMGNFPEKPTGQYYEHRVGTGEGHTLREAQYQATVNFLNGLQAYRELISDCGESYKTGDSADPWKQYFGCNNELYTKLKAYSSRLYSDFTILEDGSYRVQSLFAYVPEEKENTFVFNPAMPEVTGHYGMTAGWRSMLVPGLGQFHKKQKRKGTWFLAGFAASGITALVLNERRQDHLKKSMETGAITRIRYHRDKADELETPIIISGGLAAVLYLGSVIDAITAKGPLKYRENKRLKTSFRGNSVAIIYSF